MKKVFLANQRKKNKKHRKALYIYYKTTTYNICEQMPKKISLIKTQFNYTKNVQREFSREDETE